MKCRKTKTKVITTANLKETKASNPPKARENAGEQVVTDGSVASDWLRGWREFSGPITEQIKVKTM